MSKWEVLLCEIDEETGYLLGGSPIVHCKDCRWWAGYGSSDTIAECSNCGGDWGADEYCSCGERGENEHLIMPPANGSTIPKEY